MSDLKSKSFFMSGVVLNNVSKIFSCKIKNMRGIAGLVLESVENVINFSKFQNMQKRKVSRH